MDTTSVPPARSTWIPHRGIRRPEPEQEDGDGDADGPQQGGLHRVAIAFRGQGRGGQGHAGPGDEEGGQRPGSGLVLAGGVRGATQGPPEPSVRRFRIGGVGSPVPAAGGRCLSGDLVGDEDGQAVGRQGRGEQEALAPAAAELDEHAGLVLGLDAFRHHRQAQVMGQVDDPGRDPAVVGVGVVPEALHEGPVDLDDVHGKLAEVGQGRVAGAEVVDGDEDAHRPQALQLAQRARPLGEDGALGELQHQATRGDAVAAQGPLDHAGQVTLLELVDRHVHREAERPAAGRGSPRSSGRAGDRPRPPPRPRARGSRPRTRPGG